MTTAAARRRSGANGMKGGRSEARDPPLVVAQAQVAADVAADTAEDAAVDAAAAADFFSLRSFYLLLGLIIVAR